MRIDLHQLSGIGFLEPLLKFEAGIDVQFWKLLALFGIGRTDRHFSQIHFLWYNLVEGARKEMSENVDET